MIVPVAYEPHHKDHLGPIVRLLGAAAATTRTGDGDIALVPSYGALIRARRQKFRKFILAQHGAGQSYGGELRTRHQPGYPGGKDNGDVGLFLVPNEQAAKRWRDAYPKTPAAIVGCPKLDDLPRRGSGPGPVVAVSFHWAAHFSPEAGSAFMHYWEGVLKLRKLGYDVIGHGHPLRTDLPQWYARHHIEYVATFDEVCRRADVYVCDNSSTIFEFASTGRPVVLLNSPQYRKRIHHGLRFWDAATVGVQVDDKAQLPDAIVRALADEPAQQAARLAAVDLVYPVRGAQLAADAILDWSGLVRVAA